IAAPTRRPMKRTAVRSRASLARASPRGAGGTGGVGGGGGAGSGALTAAAVAAVLRTRLTAGFAGAAPGARLVDFAMASPQLADAAIRKAAVRGGLFVRRAQ